MQALPEIYAELMKAVGKLGVKLGPGDPDLAQAGAVLDRLREIVEAMHRKS